jgi:hypothetical protein
MHSYLNGDYKSKKTQGSSVKRLQNLITLQNPYNATKLRKLSWHKVSDVSD